MFIEHLLCTKHPPKNFFSGYFNSHTNPTWHLIYSPHFTDGESGDSSAREPATVIQQGSSRDRFQIQAFQLRGHTAVNGSSNTNSSRSHFRVHLHWGISPDALQPKKSFLRLGSYNRFLQLKPKDCSCWFLCLWTEPQELREDSLEKVICFLSKADTGLGAERSVRV